MTRRSAQGSVTRDSSGAIAAAALLAGLLPAIFPLISGSWPSDTPALIPVAALSAIAAIGIVPLASGSLRFNEELSRDDGLLVLGAAMLSAGAAAIHFSVAKSHFDEYALFGFFFVASGLGQLAWGLWMAIRPTPAPLRVGMIGNALLVALWAVSRTAGLPIGPEHWKPEAIGFADVAATGFEVALVLVCAVLTRRPQGLAAARPVAIGIFLAVTALTTLGLLSAVGAASSLITPSA